MLNIYVYLWINFRIMLDADAERAHQLAKLIEQRLCLFLAAAVKIRADEEGLLDLLGLFANIKHGARRMQRGEVLPSCMFIRQNRPA